MDPEKMTRAMARWWQVQYLIYIDLLKFTCVPGLSLKSTYLYLYITNFTKKCHCRRDKILKIIT